MKKKIFIYLFDGFSDWEIAYLTPEIKKNEKIELTYFSKEGNSVVSMGGLQVTPDSSLSEITPENIDLLILPGGTAWETGGNKEIEQLTKDVLDAGKAIAAICAATTFLGQLGLLDDVKHTSNDLNYLKAVVPEYLGEANYQKALAVTDKNIITANGIAPIEFAKEVFTKIELYDLDTIEKWFQLFKNGIWKE